MSSHGRSGGALIRPQHRNLISNKNHNCNAIPYPDGSVAVIHAYHFLEHLEKPVAMLAECQRVLRPGGVMNIVVPYYTSQMMAHDLTHRHAFCEDTWKITFQQSVLQTSRFAGGMEMGGRVKRHHRHS